MGTATAETSSRGVLSRRKWLFAGLGLLLFSLVVWRLMARVGHKATSEPRAGTDRPVPVRIAVVSRADVPIHLEGLGSVVALYTVTVRSQVDGRLDKVLFQEGQRVGKGDVIAQIDPRPFEIQLHQAQAARAKDMAQLRDTTLNLQRYKMLVARKLIAQQQVDDQLALVDQSAASVRADEAQIENARLQLDYARIKSPIDGVTGVRLVDPGNIVRANDATGIVVVTQLDPIAVLFSLPEDDLPRLQEHMQGGPLQVEAFNREGSQALGKGELLVIDNQINQATATIRLKATFPNPDRRLWPGEFVKARLLLTTEKDALVIPAAVIQRGPQGTFVYVVNPDDTASPRNVVVASIEGQTAVVGKGLQEGDRVVSDGQNQLRPGGKVAWQPATPPLPGSSGMPRPAP